MDTTNRGLNRLLLLVIGLILLGVAAISIALAVLPSTAAAIGSVSGRVATQIAAWAQASPLGTSGHSALLLVIPLASVLLIVLLAVFALRQGRGRTSLLLRLRERGTPRGAARGTLSIGSAVAEQLIGDSLRELPELISATVITARLRGHTVLAVTATPRRGVPPRAVCQRIEETVALWDSLYGGELPALIHLRGSIRSAAAPVRRTD